MQMCIKVLVIWFFYTYVSNIFVDNISFYPSSYKISQVSPNDHCDNTTFPFIQLAT